MSSSAQLTRPLSFERNPFSASAAVPYIGRPLQTAFQEIIRQIDSRTRTILVTGGASTGKTLLVDMTARACNDKGLSVRRIIRGDLLHMMLDQRSDVLLVDEANSVPESVLHAISPEGGKNPATTAIFLGVPSCVSRFLLSKVHPFMIELMPLPVADAQNYLLEQAKRAGVPELFTAEALDIIVAGSQGSPRLLRSHASMAYFGAVSGGASQIGRNHAESALVGQIPFVAPTSSEFAIPARRADAAQPSNVEIPVQPQQPPTAERQSNIRKVRESALLVRFSDKLSAELQGSGKVQAETAEAAPATIVVSALGSEANTEAEQPAEIAADTANASERADTRAHDDAAQVEQQQPTEIAADTETVSESVDAFAAEDRAQLQEQQPTEIAANIETVSESVDAFAAEDRAQLQEQQPTEIAADTETVSESVDAFAAEDHRQHQEQQPAEIAADTETVGESFDAFAAEDRAQLQEPQPTGIVENIQLTSATAGIGAHVENQQPAEIAANTEAVDESTGLLVNEEAQTTAQHPFEIALPENTVGFAWAEANPAGSDDAAAIATNEEKPAQVMKIAVARIVASADVMSNTPTLSSAEARVLPKTVAKAPAQVGAGMDGIGTFGSSSVAAHRRTTPARATTKSWVSRGALAAAVLSIIGAAATLAIVEPSMLTGARFGSAVPPQSAPASSPVSAGAEVTLALRPAIPAEVPKPIENVPGSNVTEKSVPSTAANVAARGATVVVPNATEKSAAAPAVAAVDVVQKPVVQAAVPKPATRRALTPEEQAAVERGIRALEGAASQGTSFSNRR